MKWVLLGVFILALQAIGAYIGFAFPVDDWYRDLIKSDLTPPGYVFGIVWPILYVMIAIAGWRTFFARGEGGPRTLWLAQLVTNFAFNPVFFGAKMIWLAAIILLATFGISAAFAFSVRKTDRVSSLLFLPYLVLLGFASYLIIVIWLAN